MKEQRCKLACEQDLSELSAASNLKFIQKDPKKRAELWAHIQAAKKRGAETVPGGYGLGNGAVIDVCFKSAAHPDGLA